MHRTLPALWPLHYLLLAATMAVGLALGLTERAPVLRGLLGLTSVYVVPGYLLVGAMFPRWDELRLFLRLALAIGLSMAIQAPLAVVLDTAQVRLSLGSSGALLTGFAVVCGLAAYARARRAGDASRPSWDRKQAPVLSGLAVLIATTVGLLSVAQLSESLFSEYSTTELYLVGQDGRFGDHPSLVAPGESLTLTIGIDNHESEERRYRLIARSGERMLATSGPHAVAREQRWQGSLVITVPEHLSGDVPIEIVLRLDNSEEDYRALRLWLTVK